MSEPQALPTPTQHERQQAEIREWRQNNVVSGFMGLVCLAAVETFVHQTAVNLSSAVVGSTAIVALSYRSFQLDKADIEARYMKGDT